MAESKEDRHTTKSALCGAADDDGHLKPRALTEEELKRKKEKEENIALDQERKRAIFSTAASSAKKPKTVKVEKTHNIITRMIPLTPLPLTAFQKKAQPSTKEYQKFHDSVLDPDAAAEFDLPSLDEIHQLDEWKAELANLKSMDPEPEDYCDRAEPLLRNIDETEPRIKKRVQIISDAVTCFYVATAKKRMCKEDDDINGMRAWGEILQSLEKLGVNKILTTLAKRKKEEEMKAAQEAEARKKAAAAAAATTRQQSSSQEVAAAAPSIDLTEDSSTTMASSCLVLDENGELVELNSLFEEGEKSARDRTLKPKFKSLWPATRAKGLRGTMANTKGRVFKNAHEFNNWMKEPWKQCIKGMTRSGSDKRYHGLCLIKDVHGNLRLHCAHCDKAIGNKFGQHLAGSTHWAAYEKKLREVEEDRRRAELPPAPDLIADTPAAVSNLSAAIPDESAKAYEIFVDAAVDEMQQERIARGLADASLSREHTKYKLKVLDHAFRANLSMGQLHNFRDALDLKGSPALTIGTANDLPRLVGSALRSAQLKKMKWIMTQCYKEFGTIADGSPLGANAEALMVRMVRRSDHQVVEMLISLTLFKNSLNGDAIAHHILQSLRSFELNPEDWRPSILDRAATNQKAMTSIRRTTHYKPTNSPCISHTTSLPGKEFKEKCRILHNFRKGYNSAIMFRGKLYNLAKEQWDVTLVIAGGVRWYLEWEQIAQMDAIGIQKIAREFIALGEERKLSVKSVNRMKKWSVAELMPRLIVEAGAVTEVGRKFCVWTYAAETNDPAIFTVYLLFDDLDDYVEREVFFDEDGLTHKRCREAAALVQPRWDEMLAEINNTEGTIENISIDIDTLEIELDEFDNTTTEEEEESEEESEEEAPMGRGHRQRRRNRHIYDDDDEDLDVDEDDANEDEANEIRSQQRQEIVDSLDERRAALADEKDCLDELKRELLEFKEKHGGMVTEEDLRQYASECVEGALKKYKSLFTDDPQLKRARRAYRACKLFDILFVKDQRPTYDSIHRMIDDLKFFEFKEFTDDFLRSMREEIPEYLKLVEEMHFNFDGDDIEETNRHYRQRVKEKLRRARQRALLVNIDNTLRQQEDEDNVMEDVDVAEDGIVGDVEEILHSAGQDVTDDINEFCRMNWKDDIGERGRRIYEWWRAAMKDRANVIPCFYKAVRLIVLDQVSSAAVERVFSQLTFIRRIVGDGIVGDMLELRAFMRCNNGLGNDYSAKK